MGWVHLPVCNLTLKVWNDLVGLDGEFRVLAGVVSVATAGENTNANGKADDRHKGED
jgi:hypothetical protein